MLAVDSLWQIADRFDAIVLDQWGVLHDGTRPYPGVAETLTQLNASGVRLAVLSNSGKRADLNARRIYGLGFAAGLFETVMTSGEALWLDFSEGLFGDRVRVFPIAGAGADAADWAAGLGCVHLVDRISDADFILLMGLPDSADRTSEAGVLEQARASRVPVICSNPDRAAPRKDGVLVSSPGQLAHDFQKAGGEVTYYGKPFPRIFQAIERALNVAPARLLMVGDSLEHDIAGAANAGWSTAYVRGGLDAAEFASGPEAPSIARLATARRAPLPDFTMQYAV